jgi:alpha-amylase
MKKIYLAMAVLLFAALSMSAQVNVTFRVDMSQQVPADTVSVAGSFQAAAGFPSDWTPGTAILTDGDMDGVYDANCTASFW